jgi:hypothetical protein
MATSQRGVAVGQGLRRSAAERRCPECGRHGALTEMWKVADGKAMRGQVCRWARDSDGRLCAWPGAFIESHCD